MAAGTSVLLLSGFALVGLAHVGAHSLLLKASVGNDWTVGPRDLAIQPGPLAGRAERALRNYLETAPVFLALMLAAQGAVGGIVGLGAAAYVGGRLAYLPAYLSGIPYLRTVFWLIASSGLALMLVGVLIA